MEPETNFFLLASKELNKKFNDKGDVNQLFDENKEISSNNQNNKRSNLLNSSFEETFKEFDKKLKHVSDLEKNLEVKSNETQQLETFLVSKIAKIETKIEKLERISNFKKIISHEKTSDYDAFKEDIQDFSELSRKLKEIKEDFDVNGDNFIRSKKEKNHDRDSNDEFLDEISSFKLKVDDELVEDVFDLKNKLKILVEEYEELKDDYPKDTLKNLEEKILKIESMLYKTIDKL
ncbi:MAG: hypothetical protein ACOCRX_00985 [Candidatus Woesearchaeota archaeon]